MAKYKDNYNNSNIQFNNVDVAFMPNSMKWGHGDNLGNSYYINTTGEKNAI